MKVTSEHFRLPSHVIPLIDASHHVNRAGTKIKLKQMKGVASITEALQRFQRPYPTLLTGYIHALLATTVDLHLHRARLAQDQRTPSSPLWRRYGNGAESSLTKYPIAEEAG